MNMWLFCFIYFCGWLPLAHSSDIVEEGRRIILQTDIETVLIQTKVSSTHNMLNQLAAETSNIRRAITDDHVRNQLGKGQNRMNELIRASLDSSIKQISTIRQDFDQFFKDNAEPSDAKRAIEILGNFLSSMTGVPSARDHRRVLEQIRLIKLDNGEIRNLLKKQNVENGDILQTFHYQQNMLQQTMHKFDKLYSQSHLNEDNSHKIMTVLSVSNKINAALEAARISISHMKAIMASDKLSQLSKFVITNDQLSGIIDQIYLKRGKDIPIFAGVDSHNYFTQPIAHSWVSNDAKIITTLLQIPIAPMHQIFQLKTLTQKNKIHSDLPLAVINKETNSYRFLTLSDYAKCLPADNALICQKREISIMPKLGCSLKRENCDVWTTDAVHDISNSQIMIVLESEMNATLSCDESKSQTVVLPRRAMLTLNIHCELDTVNFHISKLSYRQLREVEYDHESVKVNFDLEHEAVNSEKISNLDIHDILNETMDNVNILIERNKNMKFLMEAQSEASEGRFEQIGETSYPWDMIVAWVLISLMIAAISGISMWIIHFQIKYWKNESRSKPSEGSWTQAREKRLMRELRSQLEILVTDQIIRLRGSIPAQEARKHSTAGAGSVNRYESVLVARRIYDDVAPDIEEAEDV